ncbi:MAG: nucleotidyltransferase domain-containing protein, partial [Gemmatimonadaceae bacterium]
LPIARVAETTEPAARAELGDWFRSLYFRGLRLAGLEPEIPDDIRALGPRIAELEGVERVILIGSWARGHPRPDSDVDLIIIQRDNGDSAHQRLAVLQHLRGLRRSIDPHVYSPDELRRQAGTPASFLNHVIREGIVLHDVEAESRRT